MKKIKLWLFILYSQNNTTKKYSKNILSSKIDYKWKLELKEKFRAIIKNIDVITNIFRDISKFEIQNDFNKRNLMITIKSYDEIVNNLKCYFENNISKKKFVFQNKAILNNNNHICFN